MASNRTVRYVDFGITSARQFWDENVVHAYEKFQAQSNRANAICASFHAWHVHEWIWHEHHPGEDTRQNIDYKSFQTSCVNDCPELAWIRDVADAGKHRGLGRPAEVRRVASEIQLVGYAHGTRPHGVDPHGVGGIVTNPLSITLTDGSAHDFAEVLSRVMDYWRDNHFP